MLNQKSSKFIFNFPKDFIFPEVAAIFDDFVKTLPYNYSDSLAFLNSTIQGINFPGFTVESSTQRLNREPVTWKDGIQLHATIAKEITITFRLIDGMLNWFILLLNSEYFLEYGSAKEFFPDFTIRILDGRDTQLFAIKLHQPRITALQESTMTYTNNSYDAKEFTATFTYNRYEIRFEKD